MSFNIFASGVTKKGGGPFNYVKDNCVDRSDFDPPALLEMIPSSPNASGIADKIAGSAESHESAAAVSVYSKIAEIEFAHLVRLTVGKLALRDCGGQINVHCHQKNMIWTDTSSFITFYLSLSSNPGRDFLKAIFPGLVKTELNNFGVLRHISLALDGYNQVLPDFKSPFLNISLSH